jgi:hypothetical protein
MFEEIISISEFKKTSATPITPSYTVPKDFLVEDNSRLNG